MNNIEDDIKLLEEMKSNCFDIDKNNYNDERRYNKGLAIENILKDREKLILENIELKDKLKHSVIIARDDTVKLYEKNEIELESKITELEDNNKLMKNEFERLENLEDKTAEMQLTIAQLKGNNIKKDKAVKQVIKFIDSIMESCNGANLGDLQTILDMLGEK